MHITHALHAPYIGNFMRVGNHGRCPVRKNCLCEITRRHHGAFDMLMRIQKAGNQIVSLSIHNGRCLVQIRIQILIFHMCNHTIINKYIGRIDFSGNHVDQLNMFDQQIAWNFTKSRLEQLFFILWLQLHIQHFLSQKDALSCIFCFTRI